MMPTQGQGVEDRNGAAGASSSSGPATATAASTTPATTAAPVREITYDPKTVEMLARKLADKMGISWSEFENRAAGKQLQTAMDEVFEQQKSY